jgi:carboxyl-terminal processing protease
MGAPSESFEPAPVAYRPAAQETPPPAPAPAVSGIGARLQVKDGAPSIMAIIPGGLAAKDGRLQVGDVVTAVAQGDGPWAQIEGMSGSQVVSLVRGDSGTIVRLKVLRGGSQTIAVSLVRASVDAGAAPVGPGPSASAAADSSGAAARRTVPSEDYTSQLVP